MRFTVISVVTVATWVALVFYCGQSLQHQLAHHGLVTVVVLAILLHFARGLAPELSNYWRRRALLYSWRKALHFEFWPGYTFYLPVITYYFFLAVRNRNFMLPFYANPEIPNGGFVGESKWDFLRHLSSHDAATLKTVFLSRTTSLPQFEQAISSQNFTYPFILKPDIGQRGFGVRIIRSHDDLRDYLSKNTDDLLLQEFAPNICEAGIFYYRSPREKVATLFSITDKKFPYVVGDGKSRLGDLILKNSRARIIAATYFARLQNRLDEIPSRGVKVLISECGNHCQGALFINGAQLATEDLRSAIEKIAQKIPGFYFGRFDVKYSNAEELRQGRGFKIVEINGIGSEATHIWDPNTRLIEAYRVLFEQWRILFAIGRECKESQPVRRPPRLREIIRDIIRLARRKSSLEISS